jgi:hypothetical protein
MPRNPALQGRMVNGVWCDPRNHEKLARRSDHWQTDRVLLRGVDDADEAWALMMDWIPPVALIEEQCLRTLHRTPQDEFYVWTNRIMVITVVVQTPDEQGAMI